MRVAEFGFGQSEPVTEAALRRVGGLPVSPTRYVLYAAYRCWSRIARAGGWSRSCAERWGGLALESGWPCSDADVTKTHAELEVRRIYEPSRLAAVYVSAAYAQVVPPRARPARWIGASALASVSRVVAVRPEMEEAGARRAGSSWT